MANYIKIYAFEPFAKPKVEPTVTAQEVLKEDKPLPPDPIEETNENDIIVPLEDGGNDQVNE